MFEDLAVDAATFVSSPAMGWLSRFATALERAEPGHEPRPMRLFRWCDRPFVEPRVDKRDRRGFAEAIIIVDTRWVGDEPFLEAGSKADGRRNLHSNHTP